MLKFLNENTKLKTTLLCITSGVLLGLSYPPFKSWFLVYFGLLIFIYLILNSGRARQAYGRGYISLTVMSAITLYWISGWHSNDTFLKIAGVATVLVHPLFMMIPVMILYGIKQMTNKNIALLLLPLVWVGYEYFDNQWEFSFPWLELGNTETYNLNRIQYIEYIGVHGISFLICIVCVLIYFTAERIYTRKWSLYGIKTISLFIIAILILIYPNFYSASRLSRPENEIYYNSGNPEKIINTCITQANTDPYRKWGGSQDSLIDSYIDILNKGLAENPDLVILHETAPPYYFFKDYNNEKTQKFINLVNRSGKYLLMGIPHMEYYKDPETAPSDARITASGKKWDSFNSAVLIEPGKNASEYTIHKKVKLVPFSERVPYQDIFPFTEKLINWGVGISHWQKGKELVQFSLNNSSLKPKAKFVTLICYESVYSEFASEGIKNGAEFIVIVTNDGWWGNTAGPYQHEQYAVLRAIETRKWTARCAQTGVSCFIDPLGNTTERVSYNRQGIVYKNIIANDEKTFYVQHGDIIGRAGFYVFLLSIVSILFYYVSIRILKRKA